VTKRGVSKFFPITIWKGVGIWIILTVIAGILFIPYSMGVRSMVSPFQAAGNAMNPTIPDRAFFLINKLSTDFQRGDIVVMRPPGTVKQFFVKRVIGLPGEVIKFSNGKVLIKPVG